MDPLGKPGPQFLAARQRWLDAWTASTIVLSALASVGVAALSVALLGRSLDVIDRSSLTVGAWVVRIASYAFALLTTTVVVGSLVGAFRRGNRWQLLRTVLTSYFGLMLVFASTFYVTAFFGDFEDAIFKYDHYRADALHHVDGPYYLSHRAFAGIDARFWSGVDWPVHAGRFPEGLPPGAYELSPQQMRYIARTRSMYEVVQFLPEASFGIFGDCLHLSVTTMTTVGYGDILPRSPAARAATDTEAICNSLLLIFGLGMIFGNLRPDLEQKPPPLP